MREGQGHIPGTSLGTYCGRGMRLTDMATGHHHEARENDGRLYGSGSATKHDEEEEAKVRCYPDKYLYEAGQNESSTAQRTPPGYYSKLETGRSQNLDWRGRYEPIVSPCPLHCTYTMRRAPSIAFSPSRRLLSLTAPLCCLQFYCSSHSFLLSRGFAHNIPTLSHSLPGNLLLNPPTTLHSCKLFQNNNIATQIVSCRSTDGSTFSLANHFRHA
jgi:hypothetical protein